MMKICVALVLLCAIAVSASSSEVRGNAYADITSMPSVNDFPALPAAPATSLVQVSEPAPTSLLDTSCGGSPCSGGGPTGRLATRVHRKASSKLDVALAAIKQDILVRNRQINDEKAWVSQVRKIVEQYNKKVKRVLSDIQKTKQEVKVLFRKKKQIENLKIQRALEAKLKDATSDLGTLKSALQHVQTKASEFAKTKREIKKTIISIHTQLAKLKGEKSKKKLRALRKRLSKD